MSKEVSGEIFIKKILKIFLKDILGKNPNKPQEIFFWFPKTKPLAGISGEIADKKAKEFLTKSFIEFLKGSLEGFLKKSLKQLLIDYFEKKIWRKTKE